jgi:LuxR family transcriptional regulator, quorum-sensing system regulator LasR
MKSIERYADLIYCDSLESWRYKVFALAQELGFERTLLAIIADRNVPLESEFAFLHNNYSPEWLSKYNDEKMSYIDPTVSHCVSKAIPLVWSPGLFSERRQKEMYEEARSYGICSGITLPMHGAGGELGILNLVSEAPFGKPSGQRAISNLAELSCFRDFILESSASFMRTASPRPEAANMTNRELECLKWGAAGKSSWEIGRILSCSEATVNFHFGNIRCKLNSKTRQQAVVKAIRLGLISPA